VDSLPDPADAPNNLSERRRLIGAAVEAHGEDLLVAARVFAHQLRLADADETVAVVAEELVQATVERALQIAANFDPAKPARPWLSAILANVAKEERRRRYRRRGHTRSFRTVSGADQRGGADGSLSDDDLLDRLRRSRDETDPAAIHVEELLGLVPEPERNVLRLAIVEDLSGRELGERLGISEGAAHVRRHRAIKELRAAHARWDEPMKRAN
jgi:RNA polymerase sigma-70 factor (ECF subfamily)